MSTKDSQIFCWKRRGTSLTQSRSRTVAQFRNCINQILFNAQLIFCFPVKNGSALLHDGIELLFLTGSLSHRDDLPKRMWQTNSNIKNNNNESKLYTTTRTKIRHRNLSTQLIRKVYNYSVAFLLYTYAEVVLGRGVLPFHGTSALNGTLSTRDPSIRVEACGFQKRRGVVHFASSFVILVLGTHFPERRKKFVCSPLCLLRNTKATVQVVQVERCTQRPLTFSYLETDRGRVHSNPRRSRLPHGVSVTTYGTT